MTAPALSSPAAPAPPLRVLLVDDHPRIREPLARYLRQQGLAVHTAGDAAGLWAQLARERVDAVVLDVMLPDGDGRRLCPQVRAEHGVPVLLLTARAEVEDRVQGLEAGADDYVVKPFDPRELLARVRAVVRRYAPPAPSASPAPTVAAAAGATARCYRFDGWHFDAPRARLTPPGDAPRSLTDTQVRLLEALLGHANAPLSRDQLLDLTRTQGREGEPAFDRTVDRQISRLRRQLQDAAGRGPVLRTVRGGGYALIADVQRCG